MAEETKNAKASEKSPKENPAKKPKTKAPAKAEKAPTPPPAQADGVVVSDPATRPLDDSCVRF